MSDIFQSPAYHKTSSKTAIKSVQWQGFFASEGDHHWLGDGIYFWQYYRDALWWDGKYKDPVILIADLICERRLFLDLDNDKEKTLFYEYMEKSARMFALSGFDFAVSNDEIISGGSCNYFKVKFGIELIRYSFPEKNGRPQFCATTYKTAKNIRMVSENTEGVLGEDQYGYI